MLINFIKPLFVLLLLTGSLLLQAGGGPTHTGKPNIVLIVSDNQSPSLLGTYGNNDIKTPNIDRLAKQGALFTNAYATSGVCSPTRATLLTGLLPSQTGVHNALPAKFSEPGMENWSAITEFRTLPQTLSQLGYKTALIGKYHLGAHRRAQLGFDYWLTFTSGHTTSFHNVDVVDNGNQYTVREHLTDFWTKKAVDYIEKQSSDSPFFLLLTYNGPYMLPPSVTQPPKSRHKEWYTTHTPNFPQRPVHPFLANWAQGKTPSGEMKKDATHAWAAINALNNKTAIINTASETTMVDDGVGKVLSALKEKKLSENTLVIYTSDQGSSWGQHGLWGNTSWAYPFPAYEAHLKIPLILHHPEQVQSGIRSAAIINQYDIFPTILDFIGNKDLSIDKSPGKSFSPLLRKEKVTINDAAFFEFMTVRGLRTDQWKYVKRFPNGPDELYNIIQDQDETQNLIHKSEFKPVVTQLQGRLNTFFNEYADPKYDLWNGGSGKGRLMEDYGKNTVFSERFPNWSPPFIELKKPFSN